MEKEALGVNDATDLFRRRWPIVAAVFMVVSLTAVVIAYSLTNLYVSKGTIMIEQLDAPGFVPGTSANRDRELRIYRINDEVMGTRQNLIEIIEKFNPYPEEQGDDPPGAVVSLLRENTVLSIVRDQTEAASRDIGQMIGFATTFYHPDPDIARSVSRHIQDLFLAANDQRRRESFRGAVRALKNEADALRIRLVEAEEAVTDFKERNAERLPEDRKWNQQKIERKSGELDRVDSEIRTLETRKTMQATQLSQTSPYTTTVGQLGAETNLSNRLESLQAEYIRLISTYNRDHPDVVRVRREIEALMGAGSSFAMREALEAEIQNERLLLDEMTVTRGPEHPDRRALERKIKNLEQQLEGLPRDDPRAREPTNPTYINLQLQLDSTNRELRAQRLRRSEINDEIIDLEDKIKILPGIEQEWAVLERNLSFVREQYQDIESRVEDAGTGSRIGEEKVNEYWKIQTRPRRSFVPAFPDRPLYIVLGAFIGLTLGIGAALVTETLDGTIRGTRDVRQVMQMPPIAAIPVIKTASDLRRDRLRYATVAAGAVVAVGLVGVYVRLQITGAI